MAYFTYSLNDNYSPTAKKLYKIKVYNTRHIDLWFNFNLPLFIRGY